MATTLNGLANLYREQGKYEQAAPLYEQTLALREQQMDQHNLQTAQTLHDMATFHLKHGHLVEATSHAQRALVILSQSLGDTHPKTVAIRTQYAQLFQDLGYDEESLLS